MKSLHKSLLAIGMLTLVGAASAQVTLYENEDYGGRTLTTQRAMDNFRNDNFNDRASSVVVTANRWEVCEDGGFRGRCVVLRQGNYPSLKAMGLNDRLSSARPIRNNIDVDDNRYAPVPVVQQDYRRRRGERLFEADVTSTRAVFGTPEQRCWVEKQEVRGERGDASVPGGILGAVIGGVIGHQIGGGRGRDLATAGGVVAGAAVGANVGRDGRTTTTRDVQRCENVAGTGKPVYWDVGYRFRGQDHTIQMTTAPGATVTVNRQGEPRVQAP